MEILECPGTPYEICYHSESDGWEIREEAVVRFVDTREEVKAWLGKLCLERAKEWVLKNGVKP